MEIRDIISNALAYPLQNIKALLIYIILGVIAGIAVGGTLMGIALSADYQNAIGLIGSATIGTIIAAIALLLISGYTLDIVKYGIERRADGPRIDPIRQVANAIKLIIMDIVYYIIPTIIVIVLGFIFQNWITNILGIIIFMLFTLAAFMAKCRLAKTDSLGEALVISETIKDISRVGLFRIIATEIISAIIIIIIALIVGFISNINNTLGRILLGIFGVYAVFFYNRTIGLLYY